MGWRLQFSVHRVVVSFAPSCNHAHLVWGSGRPDRDVTTDGMLKSSRDMPCKTLCQIRKSIITVLIPPIANSVLLIFFWSLFQWSVFPNLEDLFRRMELSIMGNQGFFPNIIENRYAGIPLPSPYALGSFLANWRPLGAALQKKWHIMH